MEIGSGDILLLFAAGINVLTFLVYGFDKWMARVQTRRIPEKVLLGLALIGGSLGALCGVYFFRHKTRKSSFLLGLVLIVLLHVALFIAIPYGLGWIEQPL